MSLTAIVKNWYIKTIPGMNSKVEDLDLKTKWVELAQNCRFEAEPGALDKRGPLYSLNTTTLDSEPMVGLYRYYTSSGLAAWVGICGTSAYHITDAGVKTEIRANLTDGKRCSFETYRDRLIVSNGFDAMWVWDGDTTNDVTWELGACKGVLASSGTALEASSDYSYKITFDEDAMVTGAVSNTVTTSSGTTNIELTHVPLGPVGTTDRKIYRTKADGSVYYLIGYIGDNTTEAWTDTITDAQIDANSDALTHGTIGDAFPSVTDELPKGSILKIHRERLFVSGDPSNPNKIYYGRVYLPHYIQQTTNLDYMEISPEDGDEIMGIPIQLGVMVCIKKNSIRKVHVTSAISGADPTTWYADDPIAWLGSPALWSITQSPNGVVFLGWDHWYIFDGASAQPVFDEFDTGDILEANYSDVVGYYHDENFYAAYTDKESANQNHDRLMVYNIKRQALDVDLWTGNNITGPNCFASRSGDDEVGDLYFGDSVGGYIVKEEDTNSVSRLRTKTECNNGTKSDVFVGGTENSPTIQIGDIVSASAIPDDIVIFWDNDSTTPGSGWTEITGNEDKLIKLSTTAGTSTAGVSHLHLLTGTIPTYTDSELKETGDTDTSIGMRAHDHTVSANADATTPIPRNIKYRMFKKNNTTTEYEFPVGAIIMWDQATPPSGYQLITDVGYYPIQDTEDLGVPNDATHSHSFSIPTSTASGSTYTVDGNPGAEYETIKVGHAHTVTGSLSTETLNTWEVDYVAMVFIKRVGETAAWDGTDKYCYALHASASAATNGWAEVTTYDDKYLKIGASIATGSAANNDHNHTAGTFDTSTEDFTFGSGGYHSQLYPAPHTHTVTLSSGDSTLGEPPSITFRLMKKVLGTMKDYNDAIGVQYTAGTWTAPSQEINADTLLKIYWNEDISGSDDVLLHTRTGSSQTACEAAGWSSGLTDSNGSQIASTADVWFQYKIEFTATDTRVTNPQVYFTDGYVVRYEYHRGATSAETSVNFRYKIGFRNFNEPSLDKVFKKIITKHEGDTGSFTVSWETENSSGSFIISLDDYPLYWDSYFPSSAMGKDIDFEISKNDLETFRVSELKGIYSPYQVIL